MEKQKIIERIGELPKFELVKVAVDREDNWVQQANSKAVVVAGQSKSIAYVSDRYKLVQFSEVFYPIAQGIEDFSGQLFWYGGKCVMNIQPKIAEFTDGDTTYGITCINSVDKSTSIIVRFNVMIDGMVLGFPKKMAAFSKNHTKQGFKITSDYIDMIMKVKQAWKSIIDNFPNMQVAKEQLPIVCKSFSLSQRQTELLLIDTSDYNAWDIVQFRLQEIADRNYTSDVHKQMALDRLCSQIFDYAIAAGI